MNDTWMESVHYVHATASNISVEPWESDHVFNNWDFASIWNAVYVTFNGNGDDDDTYYVHGPQISDPRYMPGAPIVTREGYEFIGWFDPNGYEKDESVTRISRSKYFYARWEPIPTEPTTPEPTTATPTTTTPTTTTPNITEPITPPTTTPYIPTTTPALTTPIATTPITTPSTTTPTATTPDTTTPMITTPEPTTPEEVTEAPQVSQPEVTPGNQLVPDGDFWIELDDAGVPLGTWQWDVDEEMWLFDPVVPLGAFEPSETYTPANMPQTGVRNRNTFLLLGLGVTMTIATTAGILIIRRKQLQ